MRLDWTDADMKLADEVAAWPSRPQNALYAVCFGCRRSGNAAAPYEATVGFNAQEFEPSPLDELSKLELTPENSRSTTIRSPRHSINTFSTPSPISRSDFPFRSTR